MKNRPAPLISTLLILAIAGYAAFFSAQLLLHYYSFGSRSLDLGNMDQAIWNTLHGRPFHQTNQPGATNRLSLHVEPILLPISLLYLIYSGPEILFVFQSIVVALGAIPVFALARFKLHNDGLALIFALVYLMFPAIQGATLLDFHAVTLAPTFLLAAFYTLETRRPGLFALFAILAAACKEDMTLLVMMLGFYALFINRQYRLGLLTIALSALWAFVAVFVIPPAFAGSENIHWNRYGHLGDSPLNIVLNFFLQPQLVLSHLQKVQALDYLCLLLTPTAFTALLNPVTLLLALPSLGINLLSNFPPMQRANSLIYAAPIVPAVIISSIYGVANIKRMGEWRRAKGMFSRLTLHASRTTHHAPRTTLLFNSFVGIIILAASLGYHFFYGYLPWGGEFRGWEEVTDHHRRAERIFAQIPPEAALSAHDRLNPHVSQRETLYIFDRLEDADHIVLDITEDSWPLHPVELRHQVDQFLEGGFGVVDAFDGYLLLAKNRPDLPTTLPDPFFDFARVADPAAFQPQFPVAVTFDDKLKLLGYDLDYGAHEERLPVVTLYWQALAPLEQNYRLWPFFIDRQGKLIEDTSQRPLVATLWYPTSRWSPDEVILTRTLPWDLGDEFTLAVGVAEDAGGEEAKTSRGWADMAQRLPITEVDEGLYLFENKTWARLGTFQRTGRDSYAPVVPASPPRLQPRQVEFWHLIQLQGVDLPTSSLRPGDSLPFTLVWQSTAPLTVDLTTFVHLLDQNGQVVVQLDWTPQDSLGYLPTTAWQPHRPVVDRQVLSLPAEIAPGEYRLVVGWYYPVTGDRLPVTAGGSGDSVEVGVIYLTLF
ncbi:MAG: hypothetical protein DPW09_05280 [Anaerolineae bacterium]|nr:DUF2079 domain-containing protein [Anaerolineales bacterium]MCQ3972846.1 hypothetical protein [Anaerolineae bacterium]